MKTGTVVFTAGELALLNCILTAEVRDNRLPKGTEKVYTAVFGKIRLARDLLTPDKSNLDRYTIK